MKLRGLGDLAPQAQPLTARCAVRAWVQTTTSPVSAPDGWGAIPRAGSALHAEKRKPWGDGPVLGGRGAKRRDHGDGDGTRRGRRSRPLRARAVCFWAPVVSVLALAVPSSALAATGTGGERRAAPRATPSAGQPRGAMLALGSGYGSSHGSSAVRVLQRRMALAGDSPGPIDGRYGPLTRAAVMRFQAEQGVVRDGIVGPQTWGLTRSLLVSRGLGGHGRSEPVRAVQRRLAAGGFAPGPIDGRYGVLTQHAVQRFQAAHGLPVDGIVGPGTRALLLAPTRLVDQESRHGSRPPVRAVHRTAPAPHTPTTDHSPAVRPSSAPSAATNPSSTTSTGLLVVLGLVGLALTLIVARKAINSTYPLQSPPSPADVRPARSHRHSTDRSATTPPSPAAETRTPSAPPAPVPAAGSNGSHGHATNGHYATNGHPAANGNRTGSGSRGAAIGALASPARDPAADRRLGQRLEEHGDVNGALAAYRRADERGDAAAAFHLAALLGQHDARAEAEAAYRRADQRGHGGAAANLGVMLEEQGAAAEAEAAYRRADTRGDAAAAFNLGALLQERGALPEAHNAYRRAEARDKGEIAEISRRALIELAVRQRTFAA